MRLTASLLAIRVKGVSPHVIKGSSHIGLATRVDASHTYLRGIPELAVLVHPWYSDTRLVLFDSLELFVSRRLGGLRIELEGHGVVGEVDTMCVLVSIRLGRLHKFR